ncbi:MAG: peroxiredoxin [Saprospiraceae bacterium]|nr:peroxiredoxin [Saprospiraceae bacterium]
MALSTGKTVPSFNVIDHTGEAVTNKSLQGQKYILFFYGQDDTPTCTKQVCAANEAFPAATKKGYRIFGVSPDKVAKHQKFIDKYALDVSLLSDPEKSMMYAFGAYGPKVFMGKEVIGVYRKAFFVDEKGTITAILDDVKAADQGKLIMDVLG